MEPQEILVRWKATARLVPSRFPVAGLLDRVADVADLEALFELEGWTNDRISGELGIINCVPRDEWIIGQPMASVVVSVLRTATLAPSTRILDTTSVRSDSVLNSVSQVAAIAARPSR